MYSMLYTVQYVYLQNVYFILLYKMYIAIYIMYSVRNVYTNIQYVQLP